MTGLLDDKVVLVTGAGSNVGRSAVGLFRQAGAQLALADLDTGRIEAPAGDSLILSADLTREADCAAMVSAVGDRFGRLDGLCNTAGIDPPGAGATLETSAEDWTRVLSVNLTGTFLSCRAALPALKATKGSIVNVASQGALSTLPAMTAYGVSKAGVLQLTRQIASDHAADGIRANCVCPSGLREPSADRHEVLSEEMRQRRLAVMAASSPMKRVCTPDDVAKAMLFLLSDLAGFTTGAALPVEGGATAILNFSPSSGV